MAAVSESSHLCKLCIFTCMLLVEGDRSPSIFALENFSFSETLEVIHYIQGGTATTGELTFLPPAWPWCVGNAKASEPDLWTRAVPDKYLDGD
jgi:hypothetical protein